MSQQITGSEFEAKVLQSEKPVLVDFYATWCPPCQALIPVLQKFSEEREDIEVIKIDTDEAMEVAQKYGVMSLPTLKIFKDGEVISEKSGLQSKDALNAWVNETI